MRRSIAVSALVLILAAPLANATTLSIIGGITDVKFTSLGLFESLGLDLTLVGSATISGSTVTFPITGGTVDSNTGFALIEHGDSGFGLSDGVTDVILNEFLIDTQHAVLSANALIGGTFMGLIPLFDISATNRLTLTGTAAVALSDAFDLKILAGTEFGALSVRPKTVPIPGAVWLMLSGLLAVARLRKRVSI